MSSSMHHLPPLPTGFAASRDALQRVAVHIIARAVIAGGGRIDLRVAPGGFATPEFGDDGVRVRVAGGHVVREHADRAYESTSRSRAIDGSSLADLAGVVGVDLAADLYVGHDTPPVGDVDAPLRVDDAAAGALAQWYLVNAMALDRVVVVCSADATPTSVRLWPEHFDVAIDLAAAPGERVNLGGSPGDGFHEAPYAYVGPWSDARPGDGEYWNAPFGAIVGYDDVASSDDPVATLTTFFLDGVRRFET